LTAVGADGTARLWDTDTGHVLHALGKQQASVGSVAAAPDGRRVATGANDGIVRLWDTHSGVELLALRGHVGTVRTVSFAPDGRRVASEADDRTLRLWDLETGRELLSPPGQEGGSSSKLVTFSPDGLRLASLAAGTVRIWHANPVDHATRDRREAVGLVNLVLKQAESESDLRDRVARDNTISDSVRTLALELAGLFWRARIRREAESVNTSLFARLMLREAVLPALRADANLKPAVRAEALAQAEEWPQSADTLYDACKAVVHEPGRPESAYRDALRWARAACRIRPDRIDYFTLAAAEYRAGYPRESLASLQRFAEDYKIYNLKNKTKHLFFFEVGSSRSSSQDSNGPAPTEMLMPPDFFAYQAMALYRLGEHQEARAALALIGKHAEASSRFYNPYFVSGGSVVDASSAHLREAEALVLGLTPELPEDVFSP
jgi:hypothetical protein